MAHRERRDDAGIGIERCKQLVKLTKIYTRTGDTGLTGLGNNSRVPKHSPRVAAYGAVDEANAAVGLARLHASGEIDSMLARIQNDLFDVGADLCTPEEAEPAYPPLRVTAAQVERLEREIDRMNAELSTLRSFVLPGGKPVAAYLHLARTVARRAEREITALAEQEAVNPDAIKYVNRLSDHLFVTARYCNDKGKADVLWQPGQNR
jgi:cob(I)alamin adenosyltransferase